MDRLEPARRLAGQHTQARLFLEGSEVSYDTSTLLRLRSDHAAAVDAVSVEWPTVIPDVALALESQARDRSVYLRRPDLGRSLTVDSRRELAAIRRPADLQIVVGDGLSAGAALHLGLPVAERVRVLAAARHWVVAPTVAVRQARVGVLNDVGPLVDADLVVLLIGERPGLAVAEALSAYVAWRPRPGATDADRNLISNIHGRGVAVADAAPRIVGLLDQLRSARRSGVTVKDAGESIAETGAGADSSLDGPRRR